jgi:hypothetical protein
MNASQAGDRVTDIDVLNLVCLAIVLVGFGTLGLAMLL